MRSVRNAASSWHWVSSRTGMTAVRWDDRPSIPSQIDMATQRAANDSDRRRRLRALDDRNGVDREKQTSRQLHERRRSDRRRNRKELGEQRVQYGKGVRIRHEARDLDDAGKAAPSVFEHRPQVRECLTRLRLARIAGDLSGSRIDSGLPRSVYDIAHANGLRVGADARNAGAFDDF